MWFKCLTFTCRHSPIANNDGAILCFVPHHVLGVLITERLLQFSVKHVAKLNIHTIQS